MAFSRSALGLQGVEDFRIYADPPNGEKPDAKARERSGGNVSHPQSLRLTWMPAGQGPQVSGEFGDKAFKDLEIRAGQVNEWTVSLPDELIAFVRDKLNRQKTADVVREHEPGLATGANVSMEFGEVLSAVLPPRRSDEPAGLRQDIVDELADHLTCSYHREVLKGSN